jgi:hypothetical protein
MLCCTARLPTHRWPCPLQREHHHWTLLFLHGPAVRWRFIGLSGSHRDSFFYGCYLRAAAAEQPFRSGFDPDSRADPERHRRPRAHRRPCPRRAGTFRQFEFPIANCVAT